MYLVWWPYLKKSKGPCRSNCRGGLKNLTFEAKPRLVTNVLGSIISSQYHVKSPHLLFVRPDFHFAFGFVHFA
jgi:hypothetical protein